MNTCTHLDAGSDLSELDSFDGDCRRRALARLVADSSAPPPVRPLVNMHLHSFFSFNSLGYSPSHLVWEAQRNGLYAAGLCDFDVLDGLEEFIRAGLILGLRVAVNLETRAFVKEFADVDINSPGEHGVAYIMGAGFPRVPDAGSSPAATLADLSRQAGERNRALARRINNRLTDIALDYEHNVSRLSPGNCPTERHLVRAYRLQAEARFPDRERLHAFWAEIMQKNPAAIDSLAAHESAMEDAIRSALVKRGGIGYEPPSATTFPLVDNFITWVLACEAMPMVTWLDGASVGERDMRAMFDCLLAKGACALNIIPDRNHNITDAATRAVKRQKLDEVVRLADRLDLPINIGTEMNKDGQPFTDDLNCEALRPYQEIFLRGARIVVGQSLLARYASFAYTGAAAKAEFGQDTRRKNSLFEAVGNLPPLTEPQADRLEAMGRAKALACLRDSVRHAHWVM